MEYTLQGSLRALLEQGFEEPLEGVTVRLYRLQEAPALATHRQASRPKEAFTIRSEDEVAAKQSAHIGDGEVDENGRYAVTVDDSDEFREDERGRPALFQVDVRVESVPGADVEPERPVQFTLGVHWPKWRLDKETEDWVADWDETIPRRNWCAVLEAAGIWVVCGRVTICDTTDPVAQLTVTAKDADIVQHDSLGSAVTDANGEFCVYYTRPAFEETPPPWGPIELTPGPDLYFAIEQGGTTRLEEDPSRGRKGGRQNAGHCEYVELCVDPREEPEPGRGEEGSTPAPTYWRRIGSAFDAPFIFPGSSDFDEAGYAGANRYALTGRITMEGSAPLFHSENPDRFVQYRFLVSENATSNPGPAPTGFQPVGVGSGTYLNAFVEGVTVGEVLAYDPANSVIRPVPVSIHTGHLVGQGWVSVREAVDDALDAALGTDLATLRANNRYWGWNDSDPLLGIDTRQFTDEPDVDDASASDPVPEAGDPVPSSRRIGVEKIALRFEARVVDSAGQVVSAPSSSGSVLSGITLNAAVVNNNREFARFENVDHEQLGDSCEPLDGDVHLAYTVHHPHLEGVEIDVSRNDGASEELDDPTNEVSFDSSFSFTSGPGGSIHDVRHFDNGGLAILRSPDSGRDDDPILTEACGYVAVLRVKRRVHNGYSDDSWTTRGRSIFYWEGGGSSSP